MKGWRTAIAALVLVALAVSTAAPVQGATSVRFKIYKSALHYRIGYPSTWKPRVQSGHDFFYGERAHNFTTNVNIYAINGVVSMGLARFASLIASADAKQGAQVQHNVAGK